MELRAPLMALSSRRHTTREAHDSARSQAPSSGTQPTSESGPSSAVTTSPTAISRRGSSELVAAAHAARGLHQPALAQAREDALEERRGDALAGRLSPTAARAGPVVAGGEVHHGPQPVLAA